MIYEMVSGSCIVRVMYVPFADLASAVLAARNAASAWPCTQHIR